MPVSTQVDMDFVFLDFDRKGTKVFNLYGHQI